jgi:hypothetical protein
MKEFLKGVAAVTITTILTCVLGVLFIGAIQAIETRNDREDIEYEIELLNQTTVKIHSNINDTTYYCHPDSITSIIDKDNM